MSVLCPWLCPTRRPRLRRMAYGTLVWPRKPPYTMDRTRVSTGSAATSDEVGGSGGCSKRHTTLPVEDDIAPPSFGDKLHWSWHIERPQRFPSDLMAVVTNSVVNSSRRGFNPVARVTAPPSASALSSTSASPSSFSAAVSRGSAGCRPRPLAPLPALGLGC